jgi:hypothetical protein
MIKLIQTNTEQAVQVLTEKLEKLSLKSLAGENVFTACSLIRGVLKYLEIVGKVPMTLTPQSCGSFKQAPWTSSIAHFLPWSKAAS